MNETPSTHEREPVAVSAVGGGSETPRCTDLTAELDAEKASSAYEKLLITRQLAKTLERELIDATVRWTNEQQLVDWLMTAAGIEWMTEAAIITREKLLAAFQNSRHEP